MTVLVTGANGYIGRAVCTRFQIAGHRVLGLARSRVAAATLQAWGITPVHGSLDDIGRLAEAAAAADIVIDTASADHADSTYALLDALAGTGKKYVRTSGTGVYTDLAQGDLNERIFTEDAEHTPAEVVAVRYATDLAVQEAAARGVHTIVIRPSMVYDHGASEQLPLLIRQALTSGRSLYVGKGENRWGNVYLGDLAEAYLLAVQKAEAGSVYNLAAGEARMGDIAEAVARLVGLDEAESCEPEVAYAAFGRRWVDVALSSNSRVDSRRAREELGWEPQGPSLLDEIEAGSYRRLWAHKADPHDHVQGDS
ncbi:NAD-dependent epimerase/dehydratase family protein [Actinomadura sp. B10D3]|uniref:NAD-dependent epimerase/dehydratase family protein n=1 Tax=Actinomadura sp. B10D3 TaxID=3153557 RepID=UPI00325F1FDB